MEQSELLHRIKELYELIFWWHKTNGHLTIERMLESNKHWNRNNDNVDQYEKILKDMPEPKTATVEEIYAAARQVRSGILEVNYAEIAGNEMSLGTIAGNIIELCEKLHEENKLKDSMVEVRDYTVNSDEEYFKIADEIYNNVYVDNDRNLGGRTVLADTNWEIERNNKTNKKLFFRKPTEMNLEEIPDEDNIFNLAYKNNISIISIKVK